ncbi:MAG: hypothetical protein KDK71_06420 [Chlamydiia bacterium]|nr:hypothetical protein [Chlamydiia bacterium]
MPKIQEISEKTLAIKSVLRTLPYGGVMTYADLSRQVGFRVVGSTDYHYRSAVGSLIKEGVTIRAAEEKVSFRRWTLDEMSEGKPRVVAIRNQARKSRYEATAALRSNDPRTQLKASLTLARVTPLVTMRAVSNKDIPADIPKVEKLNVAEMAKRI